MCEYNTCMSARFKENHRILECYSSNGPLINFYYLNSTTGKVICNQYPKFIALWKNLVCTYLKKLTTQGEFHTSLLLSRGIKKCKDIENQLRIVLIYNATKIKFKRNTCLRYIPLLQTLKCFFSNLHLNICNQIMRKYYTPYSSTLSPQLLTSLAVHS